jgi:beta-phosphoglucomutase-like phosphatase (HAD superfamily)
MFNCRFFGQTGLLWQASGTQIRLSQAGTVEIGATRLLGEIMTPKAVFWDMDGTLIDSEPLHERSLAAALVSVGIQPPEDLHQRVIGVAALPVYEMLCQELGLKLPFSEWIVRKYDHYFKHVHTLRAREGAVEIFKALHERGVQQAIVSNSDRLVVNANMKALGIDWPTLK